MRSTGAPRWAGMALAAGILHSTSHSSAEDSPYCRKVRARAASDASLLMAPSVTVQGIKYPASGVLDMGTASSDGYQVRANATFSPLDLYKGVRVLGVGEADCAQHEAAASAQVILALGPDYGKLPALEREEEFLDAQRGEWQQIVAKTDERLAAHVISLREMLDVRARVADLERKRLDVRGEIERIRARGADRYRGQLGALMQQIDATTATYERDVAHVRTLDTWDVKVSGGVIPQASPDYYGFIQVGINLGGVGRYAYEASYLSARADEVRTAHYELVDQLRHFRDALRSALTIARQELEVLDGSLATLTSAQATLASADAPSAPQERAVMELEAIAMGADRAELDARIHELSRLLEEDHAR